MKQHKKLMRTCSLRRVFLSAAIIFLTGAGATAQPCLQTSLRLNTGIDPAAGGTVLVAGATDPKWNVTGLSSDAQIIAGTPPGYGAFVVTAAPLWATSASSEYISFFNGNNFTTPGTLGNVYTAQYTRCFEVCEPGDFKIDLNFACDDQVTDISLDGSSFSTGSPNTAPNVNNFNNWGATASTTQYLTQGPHCITFDAMNYNWPQHIVNYHGLNVLGTVSSVSGSASLKSEMADCKDYACREKDTCDDICYWRVTGNYIHSGRNIFGTLSNDDIRIISSGTDRAIVTASGNMGIKALSPSTTLDVDCVPTSAPSGLRLENLPTGHGNALVVDANGYVYVTQSILYKPGQSDLQDQVELLKQELKELRAQLNLPEPVRSAVSTLSVSPNPSSGHVQLNYVVAGMYVSAAIRVSDMQGRLVQNTSLINASGNIGLNLPTNVTGELLISLVVDGKTVASQKQLVTK